MNSEMAYSLVMLLTIELSGHVTYRLRLSESLLDLEGVVPVLCL